MFCFLYCIAHVLKLKWLAVLNPARKVVDLILSPEVIYWGFLWCWWLASFWIHLVQSLYNMMLTGHVVHTGLLNSCWISGFRFVWWLITSHFSSGLMKIHWADSKILGLSNWREKRLTTDQVKIRVFYNVIWCHWVSRSWCFEAMQCFEVLGSIYPVTM